MKKLLSIICTLALVLSVVLVPGMFSTSAVADSGTALVPTGGSATQATVAEKTAYGTATASGRTSTNLVFDYELKAHTNYVVELSYYLSNVGGNYEEINFTTATAADANPITTDLAAANVRKIRGVKTTAETASTWQKTSVLINSDWIITDTSKYLAIFSYSYGQIYFADMKIWEVSADEGYLFPTANFGNSSVIAEAYVEDGGVVSFGNKDNGSWQETTWSFNKQLDLDKTYLISVDIMGHSYEKSIRFGGVSSPDTTDFSEKYANNINGDQSNYKYINHAFVFKGSELVTAEKPYFAFRLVHYSKTASFKNLKITELSGDYIYKIYGGNDVRSAEEDGIPYWYNGGYTGNSTYALNYKLEAGKYYAITADIKGTNKIDGGFRWAAGAVADPTNNAVARPATRVDLTDIPYQNDMPWLTTTSVIAADDIIDVASGKEYLALCNSTHANTYIRNIKVQEVSFADGYIYPVRTGSETSKSYDDAMSWASVQSYGGISLVFDYTIEADKMYTISYDYHGHTWTGNSADGLRLGLVDLTEAPADRGFAHIKDYWNDSKTVKMSISSNKTGFTAASTTFKGSDLIDADKAGRVKLALCGQGYPADGWTNAQELPTFRNFKIEVLDPADYSAVDKAIEDAGKLDKNAYKDFSGVDAAIAAVVRDKLSSEQDAVDAMAKAINDAIAALELKDADYTAVDNAIAEAEALNAGDYNNWPPVARAIAAVVRGKKINEQATVDGYATAINNALDALTADDAYDYPIAFGSDVSLSGVTIEDGTGDIVYSVPGSYGYKATLYFDVEMEAGKYYSITFNYKGDGKGAKGEWRVVGAADNWNGVNQTTLYTDLNNYRSQAIPRIDKAASDMPEWGTVGMIVKADDLINGDNKYIAISNGTTDNGDALVKNIVIEEVTLADGVLYPAAQSFSSKLAWEDGLVVGQFGSLDPSKIADYGYSYGRVFVAYDYTIEAGKTYKITYDFKGHGYSDVDKAPKFGVAKLEGIGASEDPATSYVVNVAAPSYGNQATFKAAELTVTGDELLANAPDGANKLILYMGGMISGANFRNLKVVDLGADADYTAVDNAIAAANALNKNDYVDFSAVDAAIAAVVRGKFASEQAVVDGYATAINDAVAALALKGADYTAVDAAIAAANALVKENYVDFSAVDAAIAAVVRGKTVDEQAAVDAMAKAINDAVAALALKGADYTAVDAAIAAANALVKQNYVDFSAVDAAIAAVVRGKTANEQAAVDAMAKAINDAIAALEKKQADYSAVEAAIDAANALDADDYTNYKDVKAAIDAVEVGKKIDEQAEVDAMAKAINDAIDALIEKADYSEIDKIEAQYPDFNPADYTEESLTALYAVIEKIQANNNLPATEQDKVDDLAKEFAAALKALVRKPVQDGGNSSTGSTGNNTTDKAPDKTGDSSNIFVAIIAMVVSVLGLAVLVIAKKRRA